MYDVFFLSHDEPLADTLFKQLHTHINRAVRIHGVKGIAQAHIQAATQSSTDMFFVVDGDADITDFSIFDVDIPNDKQQYVHVWYTVNPVNGNRYGYGGVKCFNTQAVLQYQLTSSMVDFTGSVGGGLEIHTKPVAFTRFDQSPFLTFRSVVREVVKLSVSEQTAETIVRLRKWKTTSPNTRFRYSYFKGMEYADTIVNAKEDPSVVNNYDLLYEIWSTKYKQTSDQIEPPV